MKVPPVEMGIPSRVRQKMERNKSTWAGSNVRRLVHSMVTSAIQEMASAAGGGQKHSSPPEPSRLSVCLWP